MLNRRMPNGTYGGVRGGLNSPYSIGSGSCDAGAERDCSADAGNGFLRCSRGAGVQCGCGGRGFCTAAAERDCSAEAGEGSSALQVRSGIAVRKPEKGQEHCSCGAGLQCGSRRRVKSTAAAERDCSADARDRSRALQVRSGIAVRKPEKGQVHCNCGA